MTTKSLEYFLVVVKHLNISRERGSDFVNLLSSVDEYKVWLAITENTKDHRRSGSQWRWGHLHP